MLRPVLAACLVSLPDSVGCCPISGIRLHNRGAFRCLTVLRSPLLECAEFTRRYRQSEIVTESTVSHLVSIPVRACPSEALCDSHAVPSASAAPHRFIRPFAIHHRRTRSPLCRQLQSLYSDCALNIHECKRM